MAHIVLVPMSALSHGAGRSYALEREALDGFDVKFEECPASEREFVCSASRASAVYVRGVNVTRPMIEALEACRAILVGSVGVEYIDVEAATEKGIPVVNCPDTFTEEVADHTMMLLLAAHRRALEQDGLARSGRWQEGRKRLLEVPRLRGLNLGLIGFGRVARAVAARAKPFGLRVLACDPFVDEATMIAADVEPVALSELLPRADFISLHLPEVPATAHILAAQQLRQMKRTTIVINTSRGSTIDEEALAHSLREGAIAGAGLDVFVLEPIPTDSPLLGLTNVILSPHNGSASSRFEPARRRRIGQELALALGGMRPMSCVNPEVLFRSGLKQWR